METFEQLSGACHAAIQWLENNGEITASLLREMAAMELLSGLRFQNLLEPCSLSGDKGLIRALYNITDQPAVPHIPQPVLKRTWLNHQKEKRQPHRMNIRRAEERQRKPVLPAGYDSLPSKESVQTILDRIRQEIKADLPGNTGSSLLPPESNLSVEHKETGQLSSIEHGDIPNRPYAFEQPDVSQGWHFLPGHQAADAGHDRGKDVHEPLQRTLAAPLVDIEENKQSSWLKKYPEHGHAAATMLSGSGDLNVSADALKKWAEPVSDQTRTNRTRAGSGGKSQNNEPRAANGSQADFKNSRSLKKISPPVSAKQGFQKPASQLEQLVQRWEDKTSHATDEKSVEKSVLRPPETEAGVSAETFPMLEKNEREEMEMPSIERLTPTPVESDQVFITTLERVLKREIRRHGMEEKA